MRTTFIGGGNLATALINGLARAGDISNTVRVADPADTVRDRLHSAFGIECHADAAKAVEDAEMVILAVKPQVMPAVLDALAGEVPVDTLVVSVAAGIRIAQITNTLGVPAVIRAMPNTPALLGAGVTGIFASEACTSAQREAAANLLAAAGATVEVNEEALIDVVTAVSGSGPAYFFLLTEALRNAGEALGLDPEAANTLATHTAHGAGVMTLEGGADVAELRRRVTSPGGTTQAALETLDAGGFSGLVADAVQAATRRGRELSGEGDAS